MDAVDKLAVALIRTLNRDIVERSDTDEWLLATFGQAARVLAEPLVEIIREEVQRALREAAQDGVSSTP